MKRYQALGIFLLILGTILFPSVPINSSVSSATHTLLTVENQEPQFLLADGNITYEGLDFWRSEAAGDIFDIEWVMNISTFETMNITSLSSSVVKFGKHFRIVVNSAYQKSVGVTYNPTSYGLVFTDDALNPLENSSTLTFSATRYVNKSTGERTLAQNPYGATYVIVAAYYDDSEVYPFTMSIVVSLGHVGSFTNVFNVNASTWEIGAVVNELFTVSGEGTLQNYETWILERNENPEGYSSYTHTREYEKNSGFFVKEDIRGVITNDLFTESRRWVDDLGGVIKPYQTNQTQGIPGWTFSILLMSIIGIIAVRRFKAKKVV